MILEASKETKFTNSNNWYEMDHKISYTYVVVKMTCTHVMYVTMVLNFKNFYNKQKLPGCQVSI